LSRTKTGTRKHERQVKIKKEYKNKADKACKGYAGILKFCQKHNLNQDFQDSEIHRIIAGERRQCHKSSRKSPLEGAGGCFRCRGLPAAQGFCPEQTPPCPPQGGIYRGIPPLNLMALEDTPPA